MPHDDGVVIRTSPDGREAWVEATPCRPPPAPLSKYEARVGFGHIVVSRNVAPIMFVNLV